jgi:acyl carrier protein
MPSSERIIHIVRQAAGLPINEPITADTGLVGSGLWLDSVAVLEVLVALEKEYKIELDRTKLSQGDALKTVGTLTNVIRSLTPGEP